MRLRREDNFLPGPCRTNSRRDPRSLTTLDSSLVKHTNDAGTLHTGRKTHATCPEKRLPTGL